MNIALFGRDIDLKWGSKLEFLFNTFSSKGVSLYYFHELYTLFAQEINLPQGAVFTTLDDIDVDIDLFLTLGGDGTFLSSLSYVKDKSIPVAGIDFGRLGFLTAAKILEDDNKWINSLINSDYIIENRPILKLSCGNQDIYPYALNEIYLHRTGTSMLGIDVRINGTLLPRYWADGLLVATPTGSTAYSLSIGGPIVTLGSNIFIISPIAPHNLNVRPLIVPDNSEIEIGFDSRDVSAMINLDNRNFTIGAYEKIKISKADFTLNSVSFSESNFFTALKNKLFWGEDKRNN